MRAIRFLTAFVLLPAAAFAQQIPDLGYNPPVPRPAYERDKGPVVAIDEAHKNTQTAEGQFKAFAELLRRDGYRVNAFTQTISAESLKGVDVLVIGDPSARAMSTGPVYSDAEVAALSDWVERGGSLLLILDHLHAPAGGAQIAEALGVKNWHNGYAAVETSEGRVGLIIFRRAESALQERPALIRTYRGWLTYQGADAILTEHSITAGRGQEERVSSVMTFVGSAFQAPAGAEPLMVMPQQAISLAPPDLVSSIRTLGPETPQIAVAGWFQGAVMKVGQGRVALFGEALCSQPNCPARKSTRWE